MSDSILDLAPPPYDRRVRYGDAPQHFFDLRLPAGSHPTRTVVNIHGGYWRAKYNLEHAGYFCAALTQAGCFTVNLEYHRVPDPGSGWPGTFSDLRQAFGHVVGQCVSLRIDPARITVTGHSAGGQLALWLASQEPRIARVVSLAGVLDLRRAYELHLSNDAVVEFLGGRPEQRPAQYLLASPVGLQVRNAEQVIVHGTEDSDVPLEMSKHYVEAKAASGERIRYIELSGADHFDLIDPRSKYWDEIAAAILDDSPNKG